MTLDAYYADDSVTLYHGDCLDILKSTPDSSIDSIATDPPYGLNFMGRDWDKALPDPAIWAELLRVAKPGAHAVIFGHPRLYHRLACAIEDAGWEVRDCLMWIYGTGFPKSLDVSKAIDRQLGDPRKVQGSGPAVDRTALDYGGATGKAKNGLRSTFTPDNDPRTEAARQWEGWGTALKPAYEPILLVRKPLIGTVAANVLEHGVGGININGCRVGDKSTDSRGLKRTQSQRDNGKSMNFGIWKGGVTGSGAGRWPANLILDPEAGAMLDAMTGDRPVSGTAKAGIAHTQTSMGYKGRGRGASTPLLPNDSGGASRFFYCAKASRKERTHGGAVVNKHPTVKPLALMRWLVRLVTPPGGVVMEPFSGSGSTLIAAVSEGMRVIGCERDEESAATSRDRIRHHVYSEEEVVEEEAKAKEETPTGATIEMEF